MVEISGLEQRCTEIRRRDDKECAVEQVVYLKGKQKAPMYFGAEYD
jgi:hypothetical protein